MQNKFMQKLGLFLISSIVIATFTPVTFAENEDFCKIDKCDSELAFEINNLKQELKGADSFIKALKQLEIEEESITEAVTKLDELLQKGNEILAKMLEKVSSTLLDEEALDEYWDILEDLEETADDQADYVMEYVEKSPDLMKKFEELMPEMKEVKEMQENFEEFSEDFFEDFAGEFTGEFSGEMFAPIMADFSESEQMIGDFLQDMKFESEVFTQVMRKISDDLKNEMAKYLEDDQVSEIMGNLMENMEVFGKDFTNELIKNQTDFLQMFDEFSSSDNVHFEEGDKANELYNRSKETIIPEEFVEELGKLWNEIFTNQNKVKNLKRVEEILTQIDRENVLGEKPIEFFDVPFEEQAWYWEPIMAARNNGIISGYRDAQGLTGYFGPNDNVTYAEALKMILEASGNHPESGENAKIWYQPYLDKLDALNLDRLNSKTYDNWNAYSKRRDIVVMINEVFGLEPISYIEGTFSDLKANDPIADDAMAAYLAEIFTGEGETGNLNPEGNINRASFAKVINVAMEYFDRDNFLDRLEDFEKEFETSKNDTKDDELEMVESI